jgi:hypothetical protein
MGLIKKCDVKNYFSTHPHKGLHSFRLVNRLEPAGWLKVEPGRASANTASFVEDYSVEHSSFRVSVTSIKKSASSDILVVSATVGNPQG